MRHLLALALAPALVAAPRETGFLNRTVKVNNVEYRYQVYVPAEWNKTRAWPVILFLHGAGERGDDGLAQTQVGLGGGIRFHADRFPAVTVMPQCRKDTRWTDPQMEAQVFAALAKSMKEFRGDPKRLYLTGLSMGGFGSIAFAAKRAGQFAAVVPICGGVLRRGEQPPPGDPYAEAAAKIGKTPVWLFHGGADPTVPVTESRKMEAALKAAGGDVRYTEYPGVGHNSWDKAYAEVDMAKWLFEQRLK
jgi:predicted peptidase